MIEMTNRYMGRNAQFMLDVMRETGINVVACTGYYQDAFFPEHVANRKSSVVMTVLETLWGRNGAICGVSD